jgi:two-component system OmpR family response regulator
MAHILIADDVKDNRDPMGVYFRLLTNWRVVLADCGEDALFKYETARRCGDPFDVLVLDIAMPDISGLKVAQVVRNGGDRVPIVFFTAYDRAPNRHVAQDVEAAAYLTKPMTPMDLEAALQKLVPALAV